MARRAFTLLEMLVVLAIAVAVAGVVAPLSLEWLSRDRYAHAAASVETALATARAEAQRRARPLTVVVSRSQTGSVMLATAALPAAPPEPEAWPASIPDRSADTAQGEPTELPEGVELVQVDPKAEASDPGPALTTLAVILPTGEVIAPRRWRLSDPSGRRSDLEIGRWTGVVTLRPADPETPPEPPGETR